MHVRAGSSIIANYVRQSAQEGDDHSPKSYKMPANFRHGVDSQIDSVQGAPESAQGGAGSHEMRNVTNKSQRTPVHSFTTPAAMKT